MAVGTIRKFDVLDTSLWCTNYCWGGDTSDLTRANEAIYVLDSNVLFQNGHAIIRVDTLLTPIIEPKWGYLYDSATMTTSWAYLGLTEYNYQSGVLYSKDPFEYKYGYFETKAKLPFGIENPSFWLYEQKGCSDPAYYYNEIDVLENTPTDSFEYHVAIHYWENDSCGDAFRGTDLQDDFYGGTNTYGMKWQPNQVDFYFDGRLVKSYYDTNYIPTHAMNLIYSFRYIPPPAASNPMSLPQYFIFDDMKVYQLATYCANDEVLCSYNNTTYNRAVKKSITSGGVSCNVNINTSDSLTMRATDYILLDEGTTINPDGTGYFSTIIQECPE